MRSVSSINYDISKRLGMTVVKSRSTMKGRWFKYKRDLITFVSANAPVLVTFGRSESNE